ncbi:MAG: ABC transporter ATP-binding protein [Acidisphaera sp.]|nr:ABC transporter ATP-binding protein [Acidisphaera sp.]
MPIVRLAGVRKSYAAVTALSGVDLAVEEGEFLTLLGPSGSGKTTILNIIAGMIRPSAGRVYIRDADVTDVPPSKRQLGMVFQNYALMPHMTVFENIAFPLRVRKLPKAEIRARVEAVLRTVQLPDIAGRKPHELSGGQQQRVSIARCLVYNPSIILMDEPLGALDRKLREQMQLEIKRLHRELGITMLYVTHDQEEALVLSDRVCLVNRGAIEQIDVPARLYTRPASHFAATFLGDSNLLPGTLTAAHPAATVRGPMQATIRAAEACPVQQDGAVSILVRPESIRLLEAGESACNMLEGTIDEVIFAGGTTRYQVKLGDRTIVTVRQTQDETRPVRQPGSAVRMGWTAASTILLPAQ